MRDLTFPALEQWERDKSQKRILSEDEINEIARKMDLYAEVEEERRNSRRLRAEQSRKNGKSKSTASKRTQNLTQSSPRESRSPQNSAGNRKMETPHTTRAE